MSIYYRQILYLKQLIAPTRWQNQQRGGVTGPRHLGSGRDLNHCLSPAPCFTNGEMEAQRGKRPVTKSHDTELTRKRSRPPTSGKCSIFNTHT